MALEQTFKLATWNVNSIRIRLELLKILVEQENPDIICIQEVKAKREDFPFEEIEALGYKNIALPEDTVFMGEVGLTGELRAIGGCQKRIDECIKLGFQKVILPKGNKRGLRENSKIQLLFADNIFTALSFAMAEK